MIRAISYLLAFAISLLWVSFGVPFIFRCLGVEMRIPRRRHFEQPSEFFHVLDGLLTFGFGAAVFTVSLYVLLSSVFHTPSKGRSELWMDVAGWLIAGIVNGWINAAVASKQQR